jgi:hypothetical protein
VRGRKRELCREGRIIEGVRPSRNGEAVQAEATSYLSLETRFILLLLAWIQAERSFIQLLEFHQGVK